MDKASDFGSEDCAFESHRGRSYVFFYIKTLNNLPVNMLRTTWYMHFWSKNILLSIKGHNLFINDFACFFESARDIVSLKTEKPSNVSGSSHVFATLASSLQWAASPPRNGVRLPARWCHSNADAHFNRVTPPLTDACRSPRSNQLIRHVSALENARQNRWQNVCYSKYLDCFTVDPVNN